MRNSVVFLTIVLLFCFPERVFCQVNQELVDKLNQALIWEVKSKEQCEFHSDNFNIIIPYNRIIAEKEEKIRLLSDVIQNISGKIDKNWLKIEKSGNLNEALNMDADNEIQLVRIYDDILYRFGQPDARKIVNLAKNQCVQHALMLINTGQKLLNGRNR